MTSHPINLPLLQQPGDVVHVTGYGLASIILAAYIAERGRPTLYTPRGLLGELRDEKSMLRLFASLAALPLTQRVKTLVHGVISIPEAPGVYRKSLVGLSRIAAIVSPRYIRGKNSLRIHYAVCPPGGPLVGASRAYFCRCGSGPRLATSPLNGCSCIETEACIATGDAVVVYDTPRDLYLVPQQDRMLSSILDVIERVLTG